MMDAQQLEAIRGRVLNTPASGPTPTSLANPDRADLLAEVDRLHRGLEALADHLDVEGQVLDGPTVAGALRQVVNGT